MKNPDQVLLTISLTMKKKDDWLFILRIKLYNNSETNKSEGMSEALPDLRRLFAVRRHCLKGQARPPRDSSRRIAAVKMAAVIAGAFISATISTVRLRTANQVLYFNLNQLKCLTPVPC